LIVYILYANCINMQTLRVGVITDGDTNDQGYNYQVLYSAGLVQDYYGADLVQMTVASNVTSATAACYNKSVEFIQSGANVLILITSLFLNCANQVSDNYPYIPILLGGFTGLEPNYPNISFTNKVTGLNELKYLLGVLNGKQKNTHKVCLISNFAIATSLYVTWANLQFLGIRSVNPNTEFIVVETTSFNNVTQETTAFNYVKSINCTILTSHLNSAYLHNLAKDNGMYSIGWASDKRLFVGESVLTSIVKHWEVPFIDFLDKLLIGNYSNQVFDDSITNGGIALAPYSTNVDSRAAAHTDLVKSKILRGKVNIFCGDAVMTRYGTQCTTEANLSQEFLPGFSVVTVNNL